MTRSHSGGTWRGTTGGELREELVRGLLYASQAHYADAAMHFAVVRERLGPGQSQLLAALDAFVESHTRYWQAQVLLHEATHRFVLTSNDQEARLADLQEAMAALGDDVLPPLSEPRAHPKSPELPQPKRLDGTSSSNPPPLSSNPPPLSIVCFGRFRVEREGVELELCRNRNGQAILRYLAGQPRHRASQEALVEALWPEDEPEVSRHKLHVAVSALRQSLGRSPKGGGYIVNRDGVYELNPHLSIQVDVDRFEAEFAAGRAAGGADAVGHFTAACELYTGVFLGEDLYAEWTTIRREQLAQAHLHMCRALSQHYLAVRHYAEACGWATAILAEDRCNEAAYRLLMRACAADGRRADALRHYQRCEAVLEEDLGMQPLPETTAVFYAVLRGEAPPPEIAEGA